MKACLGLLIVLLFVSSCRTSTTEEIKTSGDIMEGEACLLKLSDIEFTKSLNNAKSTASVSDDKLLLTSPAKSDYFNEPDGKVSYSTAPVLLTKIDNTQPFTFLTKVTPTFIDTYDAGALYIYQNSKWWFKFAFEQDERKKTRIVTVRTTETSDDNNHDVVDSTSVFMKISSDLKVIGFYYSLDKENWQLVRLFKNDYPKELWLGLSSQSPIGNGTSTSFAECSLTQKSIIDFRLGN
jgi:regulation of enolase protein 1 (concanavalin A-like superfamily)